MICSLRQKKNKKGFDIGPVKIELLGASTRKVKSIGSKHIDLNSIQGRELSTLL